MPVICPRGKRGYPEHIALEKLARYAESDRPGPKPVRVYECGECGCWHLTSAPKIETREAPPGPGSRVPRVPPPGRPGGRS